MFFLIFLVSTKMKKRVGLHIDIDTGVKRISSKLMAERIDMQYYELWSATAKFIHTGCWGSSVIRTLTMLAHPEPRVIAKKTVNFI